MRNLIPIQKCALLIPVILLILQECSSIPYFTCPTKAGEDMPRLPTAYTTNIRVNYPAQQKSVDVRLVINEDESQLAVDFWSDKRHIRYIQHTHELLVIKYNSDGAPTCTLKRVSNIEDNLEEEDSGPNSILQKWFDVVYGASSDKFIISDVITENGVVVKKWEGCFDNPKINISLAFTELNWKQGHTSTLHKGKYIVSAEAQIKNDYLVALYSNLDPVMPPDSEFQPPENVYCEGFRADKKLPDMNNFFSYDSELIVFESSMGIAPVSSHRTVYYDFPSGIARTDFYDGLAEDQDLFSPVTAQGISIIHDFNSGVQYRLDPLTGDCSFDSFKATIGPVNIMETVDNKMPNGVEFFSLNAPKTSYNGVFSTRGYSADVYTAPVETSNGKKKVKYIYSWYFSTNRTQVVEKENVERNVLLRMVVRPEAADGKEGEVDVNFYNFEKEEPSIFMYDLRSCYNESFSKIYVLTFPANEKLKGSEKMLKTLIHQAIRTVTGVSKQRIYVSEVFFSGKYMYAEFKLLASPDVLGPVTTSSTKEISLDDALAKLKASVTADKFNILVPTIDSSIVLRLEPDGLNEFAGDRKKIQPVSSYKEGSVIGLTIGMLILGFILGGVTLNLVMSKKFGVSLCQKKKNNDPFNYSDGESSM